jgi:DNA-binding GntR family transcriptional regulator
MARKDRRLMQHAYREIKRRIITLELQPGQRIDDVHLAGELDLSRTPVREAIFLLGSEGLIEVNSGAGTIVRSLDLLDISQLLEMHLVVSKAVARLAAMRIEPAQIAELQAAAARVEDAIADRDALATTSANSDFHRIEATAAHNKHLEAAAGSIEDQLQRLAYVCFCGLREWSELDGHFRRMGKDHERLIAAYEKGDAEDAEAIALAHVTLFRDRIRHYLLSQDAQFTIKDGELEAVALTTEDIRNRSRSAMSAGDGVA